MRIKIWVSTNKVGSKCEKIISIPDDEWEDWRDNGHEQERDEFLLEQMNDMIEWNWEEVRGQSNDHD